MDTRSGQGLTLWAPAIAYSGDDDGVGYRWAGTDWVRGWKLGAPPVFFWPVLSPPGTQYLIWEGAGATNKYRLWLSRVDSNAVAPPETVAAITPFQVEYSAAVTPKTRWAAFYDQLPTDGLRLFTSTQPAAWVESQPGNYGLYGVSVAPLNDSTAAVAWTNEGHLDNGVGEIRSGVWYDPGVRFGGPDEAPNRARFRPRPSGGLWLAWGTKNPTVRISTYLNGTLSTPETLRCAYLSAPPSSFRTDSPDLSRDDGEYPAVAWGSNVGNYHEYLSVVVPTDAGFTMADELQDMPGRLPSVARDANGDVWVAAMADYGGVYWSHSYTKAIVATISLQQTQNSAEVDWQLSEPAPETWWAILRAVDAGSFQPVARVRTGNSLNMSWTDTAPPPGFIRYKVRRECLDARYQWESLEVPDPSTGISVSTAVVDAQSDRVALTWSLTAPSANVYRSDGAGAWMLFGQDVASLQGLLTFTDMQVKAGARYGYRLGIDSASGEALAGETWVDVPSGPEFLLRRVFPNPAIGSLAVSFSLSTYAPAQVEVFDLGGRRMTARQVGDLGPGMHSISLDTALPQLPNGLYVVRLTQGGKSASTKVNVLR